MRKRLSISFLLLSVSILYWACKKDGASNVDCSTVSNKAFAADVNPIIQSSCNVSGCHAAGSTNGPGPLTSYTEVFNARSRVRNAIASGSMPQGGSLSTGQRNSITCWIDSGAPNN